MFSKISIQLIRFVTLAAVVILSSCSKEDASVPQQDVSSYFSVERNKSDKVYNLEVNQNGNWEIFTGTSPQAINQSVAKGNGMKAVKLSNYPVTQRMYFRYVWEKNSNVVSSERLLPMEGAYNVRDLGGYKATNGKHVKWGRIFRSGDLNNLTSTDMGYLAGIGVKTIVDFRDDTERTNAPDKTPSTWVKTYSLPIGAGSIANLNEITTLEQAVQVLVDGNKYFVDSCQNQYKEFFKVLMNNDNCPTLFHCSAGKDRAGLASALFLASLGVDRETIIQDYLLSGEYVREKYASIVVAMPILAPMFEVRKEYIIAAFNAIDNKYGGMDSFLTNKLGVDLKKMRELYTE